MTTSLGRHTDFFGLLGNYLGTSWQCPAGRVFQYWVGSGIGQNTGKRVGFGSGRSVKIYDRVGVSKYTIGYLRVFGVFPGMSGNFGYFWVFPYILGFFFKHLIRAEKIATKPNWL